MEKYSTLDAAWRSLWVLRRRHDAPVWARLLVAASLATLLTMAMMATIAIFGQVGYPDWWAVAMLPSMLVCICIALVLLGVLRLAETILPERQVERMSNLRDVRSGVLLSVIALCGILAGIVLGFRFIPPMFGFDMWASFHSPPVAVLKFGGFLMVLAGLNWAWLHGRMRRQALERDALESQLRLLQAQIEPHFLFNTLANVQSLMDCDPARAKRMLESFSDYLRAGLAQLRQTDSTLSAELAMAQAYLELLQIRMEDRLTFSIEANDEVRLARLPTLLLQPLVENAIHHGLEPKVDGGHVRISAVVNAGVLEVHVDDDGMGLDAPRRTLRAGTGMALANLRSRLHTRYGSGASLVLEARRIGARATLALPCKAGA
ncbi:MAG: histidine kinase [Pseudomonadota bacterium]